MYTLWGIKAGAKDWEEDILFETTSKKLIEDVKKFAITKGYEKFRIMEYDESEPDFIGSINI